MLAGRFRVVVSDLDGTLVVPGSGLSAATVAAIGALRSAGLAFVPASGRTPGGMAGIASLLPQVSAAVCCNGAIGLGPAGQEVLWQERLDDAMIADVAALLAGELLPGELLARDLLPGDLLPGDPQSGDPRPGGDLAPGGVAAYDGSAWWLSPEYAAALGRVHMGPQQVLPVREFARQRASLLAVHHPGLDSSRLAAALSESGLFDGRATITYAADQIVNIAPAGVDKGTGIRRALAELGTDPADAVGFGDAPNDLPMASAVGHFVAMADANPAVLAQADEITGTAADDGVAAWLTRAGLELSRAAGEPQPA